MCASPRRRYFPFSSIPIYLKQDAPAFGFERPMSDDGGGRCRSAQRMTRRRGLASRCGNEIAADEIDLLQGSRMNGAVVKVPVAKRSSRERVPVLRRSSRSLAVILCWMPTG